MNIENLKTPLLDAGPDCSAATRLRRVRSQFCETYSVSRKASALLLSFFLMSVLILVAISVSILVVKDMSTVRTIVGGTQAYYAAEGVTERGLQDLKENLPGYEPSYLGIEFLDSAIATLVSTARGSAETKVVPCEGQGDAWHALGPNESIQIPLFAQTDAAGTIEPAGGQYMNFYVSFYAGQDDGSVDLTTVPTQDVLRWKVLGRSGTDTTNPGATEAMSEYIPLYNDEGYYNADAPTKFGTADLGGLPPGYQDGKFSSSGASFDAGYPISTFLANHVYNYLVLTNIITETTNNTVIYYQFYSTDYAPVCEYVDLAATATSTNGSAQQDLSTLVKEGENLPVFDFVIYHTGTQESGTSSGGSTSSATFEVPSVVIPDWAAILLGS